MNYCEAVLAMDAQTGFPKMIHSCVLSKGHEGRHRTILGFEFSDVQANNAVDSKADAKETKAAGDTI
jgi:hypothetical protein